MVNAYNNCNCIHLFSNMQLEFILPDQAHGIVKFPMLHPLSLALVLFYAVHLLSTSRQSSPAFANIKVVGSLGLAQQAAPFG